MLIEIIMFRNIDGSYLICRNWLGMTMQKCVQFKNNKTTGVWNEHDWSW